MSRKPRKAGKQLRLTRVVDTRVIYCGDNVDVLKTIPDGCVDLIYIDPPFNSGRAYEMVWNETWEKRSFEDRHESMQAYIDFMAPRCVQLARVLRNTGSFYFHCDWHASHYVKVMLDRIFGEECFRNEVIWKRSHAHSDTKQGMSQFGRVCDRLFFYSRGRDWTFNPQYQRYSDEHLDTEYRHVAADGRRFKETDVTAAKGGGDTSFAWRVLRRTPTARWEPDFDDEWRSPREGVEYKSVTPYAGRFWAYAKHNLKQFWRDGRLIHRKTGMPRLMQFANEMPGVPLQDLWTDIAPLNAVATERVGYPTQKPVALLNRIISASSNVGDVVLDAFCGCGTTIEAAELLDRRWIGIDISPTACRVMADRMERECKIKRNEALWRSDRGFVVRGMPITKDQLRAMNPFDFQNWAIIALDGYPNQKRVKDLGIDGRLYPANEAREAKGASGAQLEFMMDMYYPIQVKQKDKAGRVDIDGFETAMRRVNADRGYFVAFGYTRDALEEIRRFERREGKAIIALTVDEIIDEREREQSRKLG